MATDKGVICSQLIKPGAELSSKVRLLSRLFHQRRVRRELVGTLYNYLLQIEFIQVLTSNYALLIVSWLTIRFFTTRNFCVILMQIGLRAISRPQITAAMRNP
ncbi:MAG: hypothetical protein ACRYGK_03020 [Janthinobacterium lividum]